MIIQGTSGNDNLVGTPDDDVFKLQEGGDDTASGLAGNDIFRLDGAFNAADSLDGGDDHDRLVLNGTTDVELTATTITNIETIRMRGGYDYSLKMDDGNVAAGGTLTVNAGMLGPTDRLFFNGRGETDGRFDILAGAGNDRISGGDNADRIQLGEGGTDKATGRGGNDRFVLDGAFDASDQLDGQRGKDRMYLDGDYAGLNAVVCNDDTFTSIRAVYFAAGHSYDITTAEGNVTGGIKGLFVSGGGLGVADSLVFNASAETDSALYIQSGAGNDNISGGHYGNAVDIGTGADTYTGGDGIDLLSTGDFDAADSFDGDGGLDGLDIRGSNAVNLYVTPIMLSNFEGMHLNHDSNFTFDDGVVGAGKWFIVDAHDIDVGESLIFDGSLETDGQFVFVESYESDHLTGGQNGDIFTYFLKGGFDHSAARRDFLYNFDFAEDRFLLPFVHIDDIDPWVTEGEVNEATIDADIAAAIGDDELGDNNAVLFTPDSGDLAGHTFLIVDVDGDGGYEGSSVSLAGGGDHPSWEDWVVELVNPLNTGSFDEDDTFLLSSVSPKTPWSEGMDFI